jgi:D-alanyl-lipoteichoic acid acyltransferase DltB (MBOAT superfamily)
MLLGGLWHGAAMTFILWGALHGAYLAIERRYLAGRSHDADREWQWRTDLLPTIVTFQFVCLAWVFFRAPSASVALHYLSGIGHLRGGSVDKNLVLTLLVAVIVTVTIDAAQRVSLDHTVITRLSPWAQGVTYGAMASAVLIASGGTPVPFIYFRF